MADAAIPSPVAGNLDFVLRKYGKIWIWSILCTATAALSGRALPSSFSAMVNMGLANRGLQLNAPFAYYFGLVIAALAPTATLVAVYYLLQFLRWHLLPILFPPPPEQAAPQSAAASFTFTGTAVVDMAEAPLAPAKPEGAYLLYRAFLAVLAGMAAEVAAVVVGLAMRFIM